MKKYMIILFMTLFGVMTISAMSYREARQQARFLTDKMAYELNLNDDQYNMAYEINLDYLLSLNHPDDVYSAYLNYRNRDFRYILFDWQWRLFTQADYFFRPVYWRVDRWSYPIYQLYRVNHYYYNYPRPYETYRGGRTDSYRGNVSYYNGRRPSWSSGFRGENQIGPTRHNDNMGRQNNTITNRPNNNNTNRPTGNTIDGRSDNNNNTNRPTGNTLGGRSDNNNNTNRPMGNTINGRSDNNNTTNRPMGNTIGGRSDNNNTTNRSPNSIGEGAGRRNEDGTNRSTATGVNRPSSTRTTVNTTPTSRGDRSPNTGSRSNSNSRSGSGSAAGRR